MRVLLVGNYPGDRQYSMLGFAKALGSGLREQGASVSQIRPEPWFGANGSKWLGYVDKYALFPSKLRTAAKEADLVHVLDQGNAMYLAHLKKQANLITCHDLLAIRASLGEIPGWDVGPSGKAYQRMIAKGLARAGNLACVSMATQEDLKRLFPASGARSKLVYNSLYWDAKPLPESDCMQTLEEHGIHRAFLLHVGGNQFYKNRTGLVRIYREIRDLYGLETPPQLVLAGHPAPIGLATTLPDGVVSVPRVDDEELWRLYSTAAALVFPSLYEGFGLPIIEAQACGCPVFTSDRAPMTEVGGNAARYFNPESPKEAAKLILEGLPNSEEMHIEGLRNACRFSYGEMAKAYAVYYKEILDAR